MTLNPVPLILVVEPDAVQRDLIQISLTRIGCSVMLTRDPDQIAPILAKEHPSLVIMDTFIPGSSGLEILKELNQKKLLKHTLVMFISSFGFSEIIQQAKDLGVTEFLMKPLDTDDFSRRVRKLLKFNY